MFLRAAARRAASVAHVQRRTLLDKPNTVKQLREEFYADRAKGEFLTGEPTYLRGKDGKATFAVACGLLTVGLVMIGKGFVNMSLGINKKQV